MGIPESEINPSYQHVKREMMIVVMMMIMMIKGLIDRLIKTIDENTRLFTRI